MRCLKRITKRNCIPHTRFWSIQFDFSQIYLTLYSLSRLLFESRTPTQLLMLWSNFSISTEHCATTWPKKALAKILQYTLMPNFLQIRSPQFLASQCQKTHCSRGVNIYRDRLGKPNADCLLTQMLPAEQVDGHSVCLVLFASSCSSGVGLVIYVSERRR